MAEGMTYGTRANQFGKGNNEAISNLPENRTLIIEKLNNENPMDPEFVSNLVNLEQVFVHYKPAIECEIIRSDGSQDYETIHFKNLNAFMPDEIINKSKILNDMQKEKTDCLKMINQLKSNAYLQEALKKPDFRNALITALSELFLELNES